MSVPNTVITPLLLSVTAGNPVSFTVELMTTNPNLLSNHWFDNPATAIQLGFQNYTLALGAKKGQYLATLNPTLAGSFNISITITGIPFTGTLPQI